VIGHHALVAWLALSIVGNVLLWAAWMVARWRQQEYKFLAAVSEAAKREREREYR